MKYLTARLKGRMWRTRETTTSPPPPYSPPPGVSARPGGPLLVSEWEDVPEADSVAFEKPLKATREHEMQNKRACHPQVAQKLRGSTFLDTFEPFSLPRAASESYAFVMEPASIS